MWLKLTVHKPVFNYDLYIVRQFSVLFILSAYCVLQMPGISVKDVDQHEFVKGLSAFLKK